MPYLRNVVQKQKDLLINKLIKHGVYQKNDNNLYKLTLTELEKECKFRFSNNKLDN